MKQQKRRLQQQTVSLNWNQDDAYDMLHQHMLYLESRITIHIIVALVFVKSAHMIVSFLS